MFASPFVRLGVALVLSLSPALVSAQPDVYYTSVGGIFHLDPTTGTSALLVPQNTGLDGIAVDGPNGKLYWIGFTLADRSVLIRSDLDGMNVEQIGGTIFGHPNIAVDSAGNKIYYRADGELRRANPDGTGEETLLTSLALETICPSTLNQADGGLAFDPVDRKVYFGWADGLGICRANADGTAPEPFLTAARQPLAIAIDQVNRRLYYISGATAQIFAVGLGGGIVQVIYDYPFGGGLKDSLAVDPTGGKLYWAELILGPSETIKRANLDGTGVETVTNLGANEATSIAVLPDASGPPPPPPSNGLDLDIKRFRTSINGVVALIVENNGDVEGVAEARVIGTLVGGQVIYDEVIEVFDPVGNGTTTFQFPNHELCAAITWTATIADDDPDVDATTHSTESPRRCQTNPN